jgi:hypothetical protein
MPDVIVDANNLRALVRLLIDCNVQRRCYVESISRTLVGQPFLRTKLLNEFEAVEPQERNEVELRHRELMDAFKTGTDLRAKLSKFIKSERPG